MKFFLDDSETIYGPFTSVDEASTFVLTLPVTRHSKAGLFRETEDGILDLLAHIALPTPAQL